MPDEFGNFSDEEKQAIKDHLERTRREASDFVPPAPVKTIVISQKDEPVLTPVEAPPFDPRQVYSGDPEAAGEDVNDYSDVQRISYKRGEKKLKKEEAEALSQPQPEVKEPVDGSKVDEV